MKAILEQLRSAKHNHALEEYFDQKGLQLYPENSKKKGAYDRAILSKENMEEDVSLIISENEKRDNHPPDPFWTEEEEIVEVETTIQEEGGASEDEDEEETDGEEATENKRTRPKLANNWNIDYSEMNRANREIGIVPRITRSQAQVLSVIEVKAAALKKQLSKRKLLDTVFDKLRDIYPNMSENIPLKTSNKVNISKVSKTMTVTRSEALGRINNEDSEHNGENLKFLVESKKDRRRNKRRMHRRRKSLDA
jgi:hypothetical protein